MKRSITLTVLVLGIVGGGWLALNPGSQSPTPAPRQTRSSAENRPERTASVRSAKIRVATFNIANLSLKKLAKPDVVSVLVGIVRKYDVVAVQELDDRSLKVPEAFLDAINHVDGDTYGVVFSPESGLDATAAEKEQYAIYFNTRTIARVGDGHLYPDQSTRLFAREPFAAQFQPKSGGPSFVVLTIHTDPDLAPAEIAALRVAVKWAEDTYTGEEGVVVLGDFNAGKRYVKSEAIQRIRNENLPYLWVVPDDADTTLGAEPQAHDRIVVTGSFANRFTKTWGVDRSFSTKTVSDHFPVWAEFRMDGPN